MGVLTFSQMDKKIHASKIAQTLVAKCCDCDNLYKVISILF